MSFDLKIQNGDLVIGQDGDLGQVSNTDKLVQDILKIALTQKGSNPFYPFYGSVLSGGSIGNVLDFTFTMTATQTQLQSSLQNLQKLQQAQVAAGQIVTAAEMLAAIKNISVQQSINNPTLYQVYIAVVTKALTTAYTSFQVSL